MSKRYGRQKKVNQQLPNISAFGDTSNQPDTTGLTIQDFTESSSTWAISMWHYAGQATIAIRWQLAATTVAWVLHHQVGPATLHKGNQVNYYRSMRNESCKRMGARNRKLSTAGQENVNTPRQQAVQVQQTVWGWMTSEREAYLHQIHGRPFPCTGRDTRTR